MSQLIIPLTPGLYYHVYNRGINSCPVFHDTADHKRFLFLYKKYVSQVADTLAWVLMPTHFHLLIRIKENMIYRYSMEEIRRMETQAHRKNAANAGGSNSAAMPPLDATGFSLADALAFAKWETISIRDAIRHDSGTSAFQDETQERFPDVCGSSAGKKTPNPSSHLGHLFNAYARYFNLKLHRHGSLFEHRFKRKPIEDERYLRNVVIYIHKNPQHHGYLSDFRKYPWSSYLTCLDEEPVFKNTLEIIEWFGNYDNFKLAHEQVVELKEMEEL